MVVKTNSKDHDLLLEKQRNGRTMILISSTTDLANH